MLKKLFIIGLVAFYAQNIYAEQQQGDNKNAVQKPTIESKFASDHDKIILNENELQNILDKFSEDDKKVIRDIQSQIINWPEVVFNEIRSYREFIIDAHRKAADKYSKLSPEAKEAIKVEMSLKAKLSPEALKVLSNVELKK